MLYDPKTRFFFLGTYNGHTWRRKLLVSTADIDKVETKDRKTPTSQEHVAMMDDWEQYGVWAFEELKTLSSAGSAAQNPPPEVKIKRAEVAKNAKRDKCKRCA